MTKIKMNRINVATALFALVFGVAAVAAAQTADGPSDARTHQRCSGENKGASTDAERQEHRAERFKKSDKNGDGFLTEDEVGSKRWEWLKVADANGDDKVTLAEIEQAHKDGKLGHHKHDKDGESTRS